MSKPKTLISTYIFGYFDSLGPKLLRYRNSVALNQNAQVRILIRGFTVHIHDWACFLAALTEIILIQTDYYKLFRKYASD